MKTILSHNAELTGFYDLKLVNVVPLRNAKIDFDFNNLELSMTKPSKNAMLISVRFKPTGKTAWFGWSKR